MSGKSSTIQSVSWAMVYAGVVSAVFLTGTEEARGQSPEPDPGVPPLVIPYGPLRQAQEGWRQEGVLLKQAMAPAGEGVWLTASSYAEQSYTGATVPAGRVVLRMVRETGGSFPPVVASQYQALYQGLEVVRGTGGAWAVWQDFTGLRAWWISAVTGLPSGDPLLLPGSAGGMASVLSAGDGETAWITWQTVLGHHVVTLDAAGGPHTVQGQGLFNLGSGGPGGSSSRVAADHGRLLMVVPTGDGNTPGPVFSVEVDGGGQPVDVAERWEGPAPQPHVDFYGVSSYGTGWMAVWSAPLTPLLNGRVVYGRVLHPSGRPVEDTPLQFLFVEPYLPQLGNSGLGLLRSVVSSGGRGVVLATQQIDFYDNTYVAHGLAYHLDPVGSPRVLTSLLFGESRRQIARQTRIPLPQAAALHGRQLSLMVEKGDGETYFSQEIHTRDLSLETSQPQVRISQVNFATGVQEEPALAWMEDAAVMAWQQKSNDVILPEIILRRYPAAGPAVDLSLNGNYGQPFNDQPFSSPDIAANQNRVLMVAKRDKFDGGTGDPDDVIGVVTENGQAVSGVILIGDGPGSQRAAAVTAVGDGFYVVWREELRGGIPEYQSRIRGVALDRNGALQAPGIVTLGLSLYELSSPVIAANGNQLCVAWKRQEDANTVVEATSFSPYSTSVRPPMSMFPASINSRSPDVIPFGSGFVVTARVDRPEVRDEIALAGLGVLGYQSRNDFPAANAGLMRGREPALAVLDPNRIAIFWLKHETGDRPSNEIWMQILASPQVLQPAVRVLKGSFNRDTLSVSGDGQGRVLLAVKSTALDDEGVRVFLLSPGIAGSPEIREVLPGGLDPVSGAVPGLTFRWTPNVLFPAREESVESSRDLQHWTPGGGPVSALPNSGPGEALFESSPPAAPGNRYFRLRPVFSGGR